MKQDRLVHIGDPQVEDSLSDIRALLKGNPEALKQLEALQELLLCNIKISLTTGYKIDRVLEILERPQLESDMVKSEQVGLTNRSGRALIDKRR